MENFNSQPHQSMEVVKFDPAVIYGGASKLNLSESEMKALSAPFLDLEYEIRPDGFIYLPQAIALKRLNDVIGIGRWALLHINTGKDQVGQDQFKVFYDGAMVIRDCFVSRAVGEAQYSRTNKNQSWASALESAKTDCRQRCCKDIGIANDAWNPSFVRRWQKDNAIRVFVKKEGQSKNEVAWRRKDVDPFWNEVGPVPDGTFSTKQPDQQPVQKNKEEKQELPWLNHGPDYDAALKELLTGNAIIADLLLKWRISKATMNSLLEVIGKEFVIKTSNCADMVSLTRLYNENKKLVDATAGLKDIFNDRRAEIQKVKA